jgi:hypothetical protein
MTMKLFIRMARLVTVVAICSSLAGCDDVRVYGSVGYSGYGGYGGYHGSPGMSSSVRIGGRIY